MLALKRVCACRRVCGVRTIHEGVTACGFHRACAREAVGWKGKNEAGIGDEREKCLWEVGDTG